MTQYSHLNPNMMNYDNTNTTDVDTFAFPN